MTAIEAPEAIGPRTFADVERILAKTLPGYESRPGQQKFAAAVEELFASLNPAERLHLLAQAGCGVGKSLAYLIPAILSGKAVVVSVTTKALQDQLAGKDLPFLQQHLPPFTWAVLKGRSNYLCLNQATAADAGRVPHLAEIINLVRANEADPTFDGTREALAKRGLSLPDAEWYAICSDADGCRDTSCKDDEGLGGWSCFCTKARKAAAEAQVVVTNHALLTIDLTIGGAILGTRDVVVLDEAHEFEEIVGSTIGYELRERTYTSLTGDVFSFAKRYAPDAELEDLLSDVNGAAQQLFAKIDEIPAFARKTETTLRLKNGKGGLLDDLAEYLDALVSALEVLEGKWLRTSFDTEGSSGASYRKSLLRTRLANAIGRTERIFTDLAKDTVRWIEVEQTKRGEEYKALHSAPISVAQWLQERLWSQVPCVLVSATLRVKGSFSFVLDRLGIAKAEAATLVVESPFEYRRQGLWFIPKDDKFDDEGLPLPKGADGTALFEARSNYVIWQLVEASRGRALVLFTSRRHLTKAVKAWRSNRNAPKYRLLVQGEGLTPAQLQEEFKADTHSVLFALKSFFTGVDFQGETLSLLIVCRNPFPVPSEPRTEARCELLEAQGKSGFRDYSLPICSLVLQQAIGRLIRHTTDKGVVVTLDPAMAFGYGKTLQGDCPDFPVTRRISDVEKFFAAEAH